MDAQTTLEDVAALAALIQTLVRLLATERVVPDELLDAQEVIEENRFIASRDGMAAQLIDPLHDTRVPAADMLADVLRAARATPAISSAPTN